MSTWGGGIVGTPGYLDVLGEASVCDISDACEQLDCPAVTTGAILPAFADCASVAGVISTVTLAVGDEVLRSTRGILLYTDSDSPPYPTPRLVERSGLGRAWVHVGRVRVDPADPTALWLWIVADNLWVGAALNAVNILQTVLKYGWLA